jgi:XTP/dITP diphosphohydrolase
MRVILATHNKHKIVEISDVINHPQVEIKSLLDYEVKLPPETGTTFIVNARIKAQTVYDTLVKRATYDVRRMINDVWILADDSGLCVDALNGEPGVYSSRYSGEPVDYKRNNKKLLKALEGLPLEKRGAHFICSMVLITPDGKEIEIEGRVDGFIAEKESGREGFGYDPLFYIPQYKKTIAELPLRIKNSLSHRGLASKKVLEILIEFLNDNM